jgi:hypothetical protein
MPPAETLGLYGIVSVSGISQKRPPQMRPQWRCPNLANLHLAPTPTPTTRRAK